MTDRLEEAIGFLATRPEGALALAAVDSAISLRILSGRSVDGLDTASIAAPDLGVDPDANVTGPIKITVPPTPVAPAPEPATPPRTRRRGAGAVPPLDDTPAPEVVADSAVAVPVSDEQKVFVDPLTATFGDDFDDFDVNVRDTPPAVPLKSPDAKKPKPRAKTVVAEKVDAAIVENADGTVVGDGETIATLQPDDDPADELDAILAQAAPKKKGKKKGKKGKKA